MNPEIHGQNRLALYRIGYGDGAKGSAYKHPHDPDYMAGYNAGNVAAATAACAFAEREGIALPSPCRNGVTVLFPQVT